MKTKSIKLSAIEHRALQLLAFRAGVTVEEATTAIIQNAIGAPYEAGSANHRVMEEANGMPMLRRRNVA